LCTCFGVVMFVMESKRSKHATIQISSDETAKIIS
jgi:hypothetical protein